MKLSTTSRSAAAVFAALAIAGVIVVVVANWQQIRIRRLISRFGKDRVSVSRHLHVDRSSEELKRIGPPAVPFLDDAFDTETNPKIRRLIILTLWEIGDKSAGSTLVKALSDPSPLVRNEAAVVVGKLQIADALPRLRELVGEPDGRLQETALYSLGEVGTAADVPLVEAALNDENPRVYRQARDALRRIRNRESMGKR